jgi:hypothetical protein
VDRGFVGARTNPLELRPAGADSGVAGPDPYAPTIVIRPVTRVRNPPCPPVGLLKETLLWRSSNGRRYLGEDRQAFDKAHRYY